MSKQVSKSYATSHFLHELLCVTKLTNRDHISGDYVIGVGGAGSNIITQLNESNRNLNRITTLAINSDASHLRRTVSDKKILIGINTTLGKGTGNNPILGRKCVLDSFGIIAEELVNANLVFLITGLGGGTGSGATPIIARYLNKLSVPTISICTYPFPIEGQKKLRIADESLLSMIKHSTCVVVLPNENMFDKYDEYPVKIAFARIDWIVKNLIETIIDGIDIKSGQFTDVEQIINELDKYNTLQDHIWEYRHYQKSHIFHLRGNEKSVD